MAQVIQHKRGGLDNLINIDPIYRGEFVLATGSLSIHNADGPNGTQDVEIAFIGGVSDYEPVTKFLSGGGLPSVTTQTYGTYLNGIIWYDSSSGQQYQLNATVINADADSAAYTSSHVAITSAVSNGSGVIGTPTDLTYTDGFFDTFTNSTTISDAIDEISEAFLDLAPAKAGTLTSTNLSKSSPSTFSGKLAEGLNPEWYVGTTAYSSVSTLTAATTVTLNTADSATRFRAGKNADLVAGTLIGGVSSSINIGGAGYSVDSTRDLNSGLGSTGTIQITSLTQYNTFWAKANARLNHTISDTGSYQYKISADNGADETNAYQLWYVGSGADYPNQSVTAQTPVTSSTTFNYLSGIPYLKTATFDLGITGSNLFNPVYTDNQITFSSTYFTNISTGSNNPNYDDTLELPLTRTLIANLSSGQSSPTYSVTAAKPGKSNASTNGTLTARPVNSYTSAQSTNTNEQFLDEAKRYTDFQTSAWNSNSALTDGNLQVQNGRLISGVAGDYSGFSATTQEYFRLLTVSTFASSGTFSFSQSGFSSISPWGSGGDLEIAFVKTSDVTGAKTASTIWDFGRVFGNDSGNIKGIVTSGLGFSGNFSLGTNNSGASGNLILYIKYNNVTTAKVLTQFTVSM